MIIIGTIFRRNVIMWIRKAMNLLNSEKIQYVYRLERWLAKEYTTEKRSNRKCRLSLLFQNVNHSRNICNRREAPPPYPRRRLFVKKRTHKLSLSVRSIRTNFIENFIFVLRLPNKGIREQICKTISGNLGMRNLTCFRL
jgi:hypothetical protein